MRCRANRKERNSMMLYFGRKILEFLLINYCLFESHDLLHNLIFSKTMFE